MTKISQDAPFFFTKHTYLRSSKNSLQRTMAPSLGHVAQPPIHPQSGGKRGFTHVSSPPNNDDNNDPESRGISANVVPEAATASKNGPFITSGTSATDDSRDRRSDQESEGKKAKVQPPTFTAVLDDDKNIAGHGVNSKVDKSNQDKADDDCDKNLDECAICDDGGGE